jgi:predicted kinase
MEKTMYLMRGLPGSGKSTLAKTLADNDSGKIFSTDEYWETQVKGFNPQLLGEAHEWNQERVVRAMQNGLTPIIVDNTNTTLWEAKFYIEAAKEHGYKIEVREPETPWNKNVDELVARNTHNVPRLTIEKMLQRYEDHSRWPL